MKESTRSTLHFLMVFVGVIILLAGAVMWIGIRDYDHHYEFDRTADTIPDDWNDQTNPMAQAEYQQEYAPYGELDDRQRRIFDRAVEDGRDYTFQSPGEVPPTLVRKDATYYVFTYNRSFDWTDPGMATATLTMIGGFMLSFEGIRREQFPHVPVYRNLYRKLTGPVRRLIE